MIHHSDHGSQYTALAVGQRCREAGVRPSMGSVGDCYDNTRCESFFATHPNCRTVSDLLPRPRPNARFSNTWKAGTNPHRRYSAPGYQSPLNSERIIRNAPKTHRGNCP